MTARDRAARAGLLREVSGDFMLCGVEFSRPNTAWAVSRASASARSAFSSRSTPTQTSTYWRCALRTWLLGRLGQVREVAVLDADQVWFAQREVEVKIDEAVQRRGRVGVAGRHVAGTGEQSGADPDQQLDQQRLLVGEVPVDGRTADTGGGADVFQPHREEAAFGEQPFGGRQELQAPVGFQLAAPIWGLGVAGLAVRGGRCHDGPPSIRLIVTNVARVIRY